MQMKIGELQFFSFICIKIFGEIVKLVLAPIRGVTDYIYRNAFQRHFGGIDYAISPFIVTSKGEKPKKNLLRDILPENNEMPTVPQLLGKDSAEFINYAAAITELGYSEINWNLGCPHKVVARRGRGSGLLPHPDQINEILKGIFENPDIKLSVKVRLGRESAEEIFSLIDVFNNYPLLNLTIHARTGIQMYDGVPDLETFEKIYKLFTTTVIYNGDLNSLEDYYRLSQRFEGVNNWMLGRGVLQNPFLAEEIKSGESYINPDRRQKLYNFHKEIFEVNCERLSGQTQILGKMKEFWGYFICAFDSTKKQVKAIHKSRRLDEYSRAVENIFN